jgi:transposase
MPRAPKPPLAAGIDVSAKTVNVAWRSKTGDIQQNVFENNERGHASVVSLLRAAKRPRRVVMEATSNYHLDLAIALSRAGLPVMVANPLATHHFAAAHLRRAKTDPIDADNLLAFCEKCEFVQWTMPSAAVLELRDFTRRIAALIDMQTAEKNRLHAAKSTGTTSPAVLADIEDTIVSVAARIRRLEEAAVKLVESDPELREAARQVTSVKGIAVRSGMRIIAELLLLPKDMKPKQVVAYAGLDPRPFQSGTQDRRRKISRVGNARLRGALFMPTMAAARWEPRVKEAYELLVARKGPKSKLLALTAISRRLLQTLWRMLQTKKEFDGSKFGQAATVAVLAA